MTFVKYNRKDDRFDATITDPRSNATGFIYNDNDDLIRLTNAVGDSKAPMMMRVETSLKPMLVVLQRPSLMMISIGFDN